MSEKWWRWKSWSNPERLRVIKETHATVTFESMVWGKWVVGRQYKISDSHRWFRTWNEMHVWMLNRAEKQVEFAQNELGSAMAEFDRVKAMTEPEDSCES